MAGADGVMTQAERPSEMEAPPQPPALIDPARWHWIAVPALLLLTAGLACTSLTTDSPTFDEPFHLCAGLSYLKTSDFRLSSDHPPLSRVWAAWPLLFVDEQWPAADNESWVKADAAHFSVHWLFELNGDRCQRLIVIGRCMIVVLLLATCLTVYALGRTLFGPAAGLLALAVAALSPELIAHGRLITTDLPITLALALVLLTYARLMQRLNWPRLIAACVALGAAAVTKLSWPLVLPALGVMALLTIWRPGEGRRRATETRGNRAALVVGASLFVGLATWGGIWLGYGGQWTILSPPAGMNAEQTEVALKPTLTAIEQDWQRSLHNMDGTPRTGPVAWFLQVAGETGILPQPYVFGLARTLHFTTARNAYLMGAYSDSGWRSYFPIVFAIKTPLATLLLLVAGLAALVWRRGACRDHVLLAGLVAFVVIYSAYVISGRVNLGQRHLLPIYPVVYVLAGGAVAWVARRGGRWVLGAALVWLAVANVRAYPDYLAYFNEAVGGPRQGYRYLADSNVDWGQDLLRLAEYAREHPLEELKLAYFGSAIPTCYLNCTALPSYFDFKPRAELGAGTYVVSATQLLGVYDDEVRSAFWSPEHRRAMTVLRDIASRELAADETVEARQAREESASEYRELRYKRLMCQLRDRKPDERVGNSLFLYRLSAAEVAVLTQP